jgi:hypothetical protein
MSPSLNSHSAVLSSSLLLHCAHYVQEVEIQKILEDSKVHVSSQAFASAPPSSTQSRTVDSADAITWTATSFAAVKWQPTLYDEKDRAVCKLNIRLLQKPPTDRPITMCATFYTV